MTKDPIRADLLPTSELVRLPEIDFDRIGPALVSGSVAANERKDGSQRVREGSASPSTPSRDTIK